MRTHSSDAALQKLLTSSSAFRSVLLMVLFLASASAFVPGFRLACRRFSCVLSTLRHASFTLPPCSSTNTLSGAIRSLPSRSVMSFSTSVIRSCMSRHFSSAFTVGVVVQMTSPLHVCVCVWAVAQTGVFGRVVGRLLGERLRELVEVCAELCALLAQERRRLLVCREPLRALLQKLELCRRCVRYREHLCKWFMSLSPCPSVCIRASL